MTVPSAPRGTGPEGRRLWRAALTEFDLDAHELTMLRQACRVADACEDLHHVVTAEGMLIGDRVHPAAVELRLQRLVLGRLLVALRLPSGLSDEGEQPARPQLRGLRGFYSVKSAVG